MCCNLAHGFNTRMNGIRKMAIYEKMLEAWNNRDVDAYWACLHDDWQMTWHSTGKVTDRTFVNAEQMEAIMESSNMREQRCIYENDDILVQHMKADYANGTKDATMHVSLKKDGLLWRTETGVTSIKT
jgi:ketosteroid isomerase-like protein